MTITEINEKLGQQLVFLPCNTLQWIELPAMHTLAITCQKGWITIRHDVGILLDNRYVLIVEPERHWIMSYGRFSGMRATLEAPVYVKKYAITVLDSLHPVYRKRLNLVAS